MSDYCLQKYYLINLSTRNISVSTHLRSENYTLKSGKCIYLGNLTDELVVKYQRYSALNISLRILTKDKIKQVLSKCINATDELVASLTEDKPVRTPHPAGSIADVDFFVKKEDKANPLLMAAAKQELEKKLALASANKKDDNKAVESVSSTKEVLEEKAEPIKEEVVVEETEKPVVVEESVIVEQKDVEDDVHSVTGNKEESNIVADEEKPKEYDVLEESIKQDVKEMSYNQLYDLAKANNLLKGQKGRPSKAKLIELLAENFK
jgi:hypothetical protein